MTPLPPARTFEREQPVRVLVVDDHLILRSGLVEIINETHGLSVCGVAATSAEALQAAIDHQPDVVIIDISLGLESGLDLVGPIKERCPDAKVLMLSGYDDPQLATEARRVGASGYVVKGGATASLVSAVRRVAAGELHFTDPRE